MLAPRNQTERILEAEVRTARYRFRAATEEFKKTLDHAPAGIPFPADSSRMQRAAEKKRAAAMLFRLSLIRFSNFLLNGEIPPDLERSRIPFPRARRGLLCQRPFVEL